MRLIARMWERGATTDTLRLDAPVEEVLKQQWPFYVSAMLRKRVAQCRLWGIDTVWQIMDGHSKLTRKSCCTQRCVRTGVANLGVFCLTACAETPIANVRRPKGAPAADTSGPALGSAPAPDLLTKRAR